MSEKSLQNYTWWFVLHRQHQSYFVKKSLVLFIYFKSTSLNSLWLFNKAWIFKTLWQGCQRIYEWKNVLTMTVTLDLGSWPVVLLARLLLHWGQRAVWLSRPISTHENCPLSQPISLAVKTLFSTARGLESIIKSDL